MVLKYGAKTLTAILDTEIYLEFGYKVVRMIAEAFQQAAAHK